MTRVNPLLSPSASVLLLPGSQNKAADAGGGGGSAPAGAFTDPDTGNWFVDPDTGNTFTDPNA